MANKKTAEKPISFEAAFEKLEEVVRQLEDGQLDLSESLAQYEQGVRYLKHCHQALATAERKIQLLTSVDEEGDAETEPFDDEASSGEQDNKARSRRGPRRPQRQLDDDATGDVDTQRGLF